MTWYLIAALVLSGVGIGILLMIMAFVWHMKDFMG